MDHQPQKEKHHVQNKWDLNTTPLFQSAQSRGYTFTYDHEEFYSTETILFSDKKYVHGLQIERENDQIKASQCKYQTTSSFYLNVSLDNSKNYIVTLSFDKSESSNIYFGILSSDEKSSVVLGYGKMIYYEDILGGNTNQIVKGQVHSGKKEVKEKCVQLRVNIDKGYWKVSTFPDYSSVSQLDQAIKIDPDQSYYFCFALNDQSSITIKDIREVSEYTNHHPHEQTNVPQDQKNENNDNPK